MTSHAQSNKHFPWKIKKEDKTLDMRRTVVSGELCEHDNELSVTIDDTQLFE
jgi:hypothetical protein